MNIYNTVPYFLNNYLPKEPFLMQYYSTFPAQFKEYILYHCKHQEQKRKVAFQKQNSLNRTIAWLSLPILCLPI